MTARIPVEPFRQRFLELRARNAITANGVARELGWYRKASPSTGSLVRVPDGQRVTRAVGVTPQRGPRIRNPYRQKVEYDTAMQLCTVLHLDPQEVGL